MASPSAEDLIEIALRHRLAPHAPSVARFLEALERRTFHLGSGNFDPLWKLEAALQQPVAREKLMALCLCPSDLALTPSPSLTERFFGAVGRCGLHRRALDGFGCTAQAAFHLRELDDVPFGGVGSLLDQVK